MATATHPGEVVLAEVTKTFHQGDTRVDAVAGASLQLEAGEIVVVLGPSGSGKTTLLNLIGGIEQPTSGTLTVAQQQLGDLDDEGLTRFRRDHVGFVFQFFNLIPTLTARENVEIVVELTGRGDAATAEGALADVGLAEVADRFPGQLSGGEQQRVAIARAVAKEPHLLLCDEPTGDLDLETGRQVLGVLAEMNRRRGMTMIIVTHNAVLADMADRVVRMGSGEIVESSRNPEPVDASQLSW